MNESGAVRKRFMHIGRKKSFCRFFLLRIFIAHLSKRIKKFQEKINFVFVLNGHVHKAFLEKFFVNGRMIRKNKICFFNLFQKKERDDIFLYFNFKMLQRRKVLPCVDKNVIIIYIIKMRRA